MNVSRRAFAPCTATMGMMSLAGAVPPDPDAELLELCAAYHEAHQFRVSLPDAAPDGPDHGEAEWDRACDVEEDLVDRIERLEATTPRGIGEKARVAVSHVVGRLDPGETTKDLDYPQQIAMAALRDAVRVLARLA